MRPEPQQFGGCGLWRLLMYLLLTKAAYGSSSIYALRELKYYRGK